MLKNKNIKLLYSLSKESLTLSKIDIVSPDFFLDELFGLYGYYRGLGALVDNEIIVFSARMKAEDFLKVFDPLHPKVLHLLTSDEEKPIVDRRFTKKFYQYISFYIEN